MNRPLFCSALLAAFTAIVHILAGGADVASPLLASSLPVAPKLTLYAVWHLVSATLALTSVALLVAAFPRHAIASRYLVLFLSVLWLGFGGIFIAVALMRPEEGLLLELPQWALLLPVGLLGLWGGMRSGASGQRGMP
ncbi:hypothetical protein P3W85_35475 [Cupriavidus basilensis]|uniref:DUF423 domain-containing protein n=1 Tax=Cupriavidus basilensis TaxID=68895 RepID=A0ABT6AZZ1_9BURK|nr:hypothetical protein [Cupriavidus basilensis]MDF3838199.1 hypothetical protein [Cupriavidus basilensis]